MQAVLDVPVGAHDVEEAGGRERSGNDVVAAGGGRLAVDFARGRDLADRPQAQKAVPLGAPCHVVEDRGPARLDAAVIAVDGLRGVVGRGLGVVKQYWMSSRGAFWLPSTART